MEPPKKIPPSRDSFYSLINYLPSDSDMEDETPYEILLLPDRTNRPSYSIGTTRLSPSPSPPSSAKLAPKKKFFEDFHISSECVFDKFDKSNLDDNDDEMGSTFMGPISMGSGVSPTRSKLNQ